MRDTVVKLGAALLITTAGCAASHELTPDAGNHTADGDARDRCTIAGIPRCDAACGRNMSFCSQTPTAYQYCTAGLCLPVDLPLGMPESNFCTEYAQCTDSRICVADQPGWGGRCMAEAFCDQAAAEGYPIPCQWSDLTLRVTGAPRAALTCPTPPRASTPLCGMPCSDGCQPYTATFSQPSMHVNANRGVCIGRSDTRQFGICGPDVLCRRGESDGADACINGVVGQIYPEFAGTTCVCIVFRNAATADGRSDYGFVSTPEGCRGYRALYPGDIDCVVDRAWHTLP